MTDRMGVEVGRQLEKRDLGGEGGELEMGRGRPKRKASQEKRLFCQALLESGRIVGEEWETLGLERRGL